jgi:hypothetical protein
MPLLDFLGFNTEVCCGISNVDLMHQLTENIIQNSNFFVSIGVLSSKLFKTC